MSVKVDKDLDKVFLMKGDVEYFSGSLSEVVSAFMSLGRGVYRVVYRDKSFEIDRGHEFFRADGYMVSISGEDYYRDWEERDARSALWEFFHLVFYGGFDLDDVKRMGYYNIEVEVAYYKTEEDDWHRFLSGDTDVPLEDVYEVWAGDEEPEFRIERFPTSSEAIECAKFLDKDGEAAGRRRAFVVYNAYFKGKVVSRGIIKKFYTHVDKESISEKVHELCVRFNLRNGYGTFTVGGRKICIRIKDHPASPMNFEAYNKNCDEAYSIVIGNYSPDPCELYNEVVFPPDIDVENIVDYIIDEILTD